VGAGTRRCIAVLVAAVALASSAPLRAQAPEDTPPSTASRAGDAAAPSRSAPPGPAATRPNILPSIPVPRPPVAPTERIDQATKESIRALDLQTDFPRQSEPTRIPLPQWVTWAAVIVMIALVLYAMRDSLMSFIRRRDEGWQAPGATAAEPELALGVDALTAADRLSREGRFVEAMHMLLLQSLADIREQLRETFADSLTSREILRGARLDPAGRTSLRDIIAAVERTYFGGYPAQAQDYDACRASFDSLRRALRGGAPA
jgi:hypothetical protein